MSRPHVSMAGKKGRKRTNGPTCTATNRQGRRCGNPPIKGGNVCKRHGGAAPQVQEAADRRLIEAGEAVKDLLPAATRELTRLVSNGKGDPIRLASVIQVLDRAGLQVVKKHEVKAEGEFTFVIEDAEA